MKQDIEKIKSEIVKGNFDSTFKILNNILPKQYKNKAIMLQSQLQKLKLEELNSLITTEESCVRRNRIILSILSMLDNIEFGEVLFCMNHSPKEIVYDVGLSFAEESERFVEEVAINLRNRNINVFYDNFEKVNLWGKDLYQYLNEVYKNKCRYTVIFISKAYTQRYWTRHELKSAQARAFRENEEYILPVRFDDSELLGLNETIDYIDGNKTTPKEIAELLSDKLKLSENQV